MKRIAILLILALLGADRISAAPKNFYDGAYAAPKSIPIPTPQGGNAYQPQLLTFTGTPTGVCDTYQIAVDVSTGNFYACKPSTRTWVGGGPTAFTTITATAGPNTLNGTSTFTGPINCTIVNKIPCVANGNPQQWAGATPDAWLNSAIGAGNVIVDARGLTGPITFAGTVSMLSNTEIQLGMIALTCNVSPCFQYVDQPAIIGAGTFNTTMTAAGANGFAGPMIGPTNPGTRVFEGMFRDFAMDNKNSATVGGVCIDYTNANVFHSMNIVCKNAETSWLLNAGGFNEYYMMTSRTVGMAFKASNQANSNRVYGGSAASTVGTCMQIDGSTDFRVQGYDCESFTTGFNIGPNAASSGTSIFHTRVDTGTTGFLICATCSKTHIEAIYNTGVTTLVTDNASDSQISVSYLDWYNPNLPAFRLRLGQNNTGLAQLYCSSGSPPNCSFRNNVDSGSVDLTAQDFIARPSVQLIEAASGGTCSNQATADVLCGNNVDHTIHQFSNANGESAFTGAWQCTNVTPVTLPGTSTTADQNLMACTIPAGTLNRVGRTLRVKVAGVYSTPAASVSQMTLKVKICSVSGCGSGNVLTALSIQSTALGTVQITNDNFSLRGELTTQTGGTTLAEEAHGEYLIDLATLATAADNVFGDTNTATQTGTPSAIDSTVQNFLQVTIAFSSASASNVATQRQLIAETVN